jgi:hypothetical protein
VVVFAHYLLLGTVRVLFKMFNTYGLVKAELLARKALREQRLFASGARELWFGWGGLFVMFVCLFV